MGNINFTIQVKNPDGTTGPFVDKLGCLTSVSKDRCVITNEAVARTLAQRAATNLKRTLYLFTNDGKQSISSVTVYP